MPLIAALGGCATGGSATSRDAGDAQRFAAAADAMRAGDYARAENALDRLASRSPEDPQVLTNLGIVYGRTGRRAQAIDAFERALERAPDAAVAWNELGIMYRMEGRFADADAAYRRAIALRPAFANAHYNLGVLHDLYLRRPVEALAHYQRYLDLNSDGDPQVQAWVNDIQRRAADGPSTASAGDEVERE